MAPPVVPDADHFRPNRLPDYPSQLPAGPIEVLNGENDISMLPSQTVKMFSPQESSLTNEIPTYNYPYWAFTNVVPYPEIHLVYPSPNLFSERREFGANPQLHRNGN